MSYFQGPESASEGTLLDIIEVVAKRYPRLPAIETQSKTVSYKNLIKRAKRIARTLNRNGVGCGDRVVVKLHTGTVELYQNVLGILFSGAAYVPVDQEDSDTRVFDIANSCQAAAVITKSGIDFRTHSSLKNEDLTPKSDAWVIFTSGSTGVPKAVAVTHECAVNFVVAEQKLFGSDRLLQPGTRVAATLSPAFDASVEEMWLAWANGGTLVPMRREVLTSGPDLGQALLSERIEVLSTVPSIARFLVDDELGSLKLLILGGEAVTPELARGLQRPGLEVWNTYGPTETTVIATATPLVEGTPITIGTPLQGVSTAVLDEHGQLVALGQTGELVISGKCLGRYLSNDIDKLKYRPVTALNWKRGYFTGDLVRVTLYGLEFVGRSDEQIKVGGKRLDLAEVELATSSLTGVEASAAVAVSSDHGDYTVHCFLVLKEDSALEEVSGSMRDSLPAGIAPVLHVVRTLPTKTSGKVDKSALSQMLEIRSNISQTGSSLSRAFAKILGLEHVDDRANFFSLGGTSIKVAQLVVQLRRKYATITVADVYKNPTPESLEAALNRRSGLTPKVGQDDSPSRSQQLKSYLAVLLQTVVGSSFGALALMILNFRQHSSRLGDLFIVLGLLAILGAGLGRSVVSGCLVRLITIGIKDGRYEKNGLTHVRIWLAERVSDVFFVSELSGTPWMILYARITGSRIAPGCTIESVPPVTGNLSLGPRSSIGRDVHVSGWKVDDGFLCVAGFQLGRDVRIGNRSFLEEGVSIGDGTEIEVGTFVDKSLDAGMVAQGAPMEQVRGGHWPAEPATANKWWSLAYILSPSLFGLVNLLNYFPIIFLMGLASDSAGLQTLGSLLIAWSLAIGPGTALLNAFSLGLIIRFATRGVKPGIFSAQSREGYASWAVERLLQRTRRNSFWVYASVITPIWARFIGAKVGKNCEISTFNGQIGLVDIGDECFIADDASLAPREIKSGWVRIGAGHLKNRSFVGNSGHVGLGVTLSSGVLVGVASVAPPNNRANAAFLGIPPLEFPHHAHEGDSRLTYAPQTFLKFKRLCVEIFRLSPSAISYVLLGSVLLLAGPTTLNPADQLIWVLKYGALYAVASYAAALITVAAKWGLVGRVPKSEHNLWTNFVWRNELVWNFVESLAIPWVGAVSIDTPIHNHLLRLMGAKIGKNVSLATWFLDDPDLIEIGENSTILKSADLQTHLFHDRLMRLDSIEVERDVTIGSGAFLLPGSRVGRASNISPGSLVPRDEVVPYFSNWSGNPIESR